MSSILVALDVVVFVGELSFTARIFVVVWLIGLLCWVLESLEFLSSALGAADGGVWLCF